jgi:hypothetical protein
MGKAVTEFIEQNPQNKALESFKNDPTKLWDTVLFTEGQTWTNFKTKDGWGAVPAEQLFSGCLAGSDSNKDNELTYLEDGVNSMKGMVSRFQPDCGRELYPGCFHEVV